MVPAKKNLVIKIVIGILSIVAVFTACNRKDGFIGEEYKVAPEGFYVVSAVTASPDPVDFTTQTVTIDATFSHTVSWAITIRGVQSGAIKKMSGLSQTLAASGKNIWNGSHDGLYFFKSGEQAIIEVSFLGTSITTSDTITITTARNFSNVGVVIGAFEGASLAPFGGPYIDAGEGIFGGLDNTIVPNLQGDKSVTFHGIDNNSSYYIMNSNRVLTPAEIAQFSSDPDSVYLNVYVYGYGSQYPTARLNFSFAEDENGSGAHQPATEDSYDFAINVTHTGWKLFSIKYSELAVSTAALFGGSGNKVKEPNRVKEVSFALIDGGPGNEAKLSFDFPIITFGAPFDPSK